jgi:biotin operon repressor
MINVELDYMRRTDQFVFDHLKQGSQNGEVHVVCLRIMSELQCGRNTVYRAIKRLRAAGHMKIVSGNNRTGYIYKLNS